MSSALATALWRLVARDGARAHDEFRGLPAYGDQRRARRMGAVPLDQDARRPLRHFPLRGATEPQDLFRRAQGRGRVAGSAWRIPREPAPHHRHSGRCRLQKQRVEAQIALPHEGFIRRFGSFAGSRIGPDGCIISEDESRAHEREWLPTEDERAYVASMMGRVVEPGRFAGWIAPRAVGISQHPIEFECVRFG